VDIQSTPLFNILLQLILLIITVTQVMTCYDCWKGSTAYCHSAVTKYSFLNVVSERQSK